MTNPTNARQELLEKDFFSLLEGRGLQKPVGPIGQGEAEISVPSEG